MRPCPPIATVVAVLVIAGCGGGGDDGKSGVKTKAGFIAAGDKICRDRDERSVEIAQKASGGTAATLAGQLADVYADAIAKLNALPLPPGADRAGAEQYVMSVTDMTKPVQRMRASATNLERAQDMAAKQAAAAKLRLDVNTVQAIGDLADLRARSYGFKACGKQQVAKPVA